MDITNVMLYKSLTFGYKKNHGKLQLIFFVYNRSIFWFANHLISLFFYYELSLKSEFKKIRFTEQKRI